MPYTLIDDPNFKALISLSDIKHKQQTLKSRKGLKITDGSFFFGISQIPFDWNIRQWLYNIKLSNEPILYRKKNKAQ